MRSESSEQQRRRKLDAIGRIRDLAAERRLDAGALARLTGLPPGHARAILSGFGDSVPRSLIERTDDILPH